MITGFARLGPLSDCTANYRPVLSSERTQEQEQGRNLQTATFRQEVISGHKSQSGLDTSRKVTSTPISNNIILATCKIKVNTTHTYAHSLMYI
jgi:hypothetical protein